MREHAAGVLREEHEKLELLGRESDFVVAADDPAAVAVDDEVSATGSVPSPTGAAAVRRSATRMRASSSSLPNGFVT